MISKNRKKVGTQTMTIDYWKAQNKGLKKFLLGGKLSQKRSESNETRKSVKLHK